jgi:hypothetical protein
MPKTPIPIRRINVIKGGRIVRVPVNSGRLGAPILPNIQDAYIGRAPDTVPSERKLSNEMFLTLEREAALKSELRLARMEGYTMRFFYFTVGFLLAVLFASFL